MGIPVKLAAFEGPLDLLLHLIESNKIDIYDIPIVTITDQYMEYIRSMETKDLNVMSEFLVMAATLLEIKAKMLLPAEVDEEGEEIDPRAELVERLLEYKLYKYMAAELKEREGEAERALYRQADIPLEVASYVQPVDLEEMIGDLTLRRLNEIFRSVLRRSEDKIDPVRSKFGEIEKEEVSLEDKMAYVEEALQRNPSTSFRKLLRAAGRKGKMQVIVTFLAVLELMKVGRLTVRQDATFGEIYIEAGEPAPGSGLSGNEEKTASESGLSGNEERTAVESGGSR